MKCKLASLIVLAIFIPCFSYRYAGPPFHAQETSAANQQLASHEEQHHESRIAEIGQVASPLVPLRYANTMKNRNTEAAPVFTMAKAEIPAPVQQPSQKLWLVKPDSKLTVGETIEYDIKWTGVHGGTAVLRVVGETQYQNTPVYHVKSVTRSNAFVSMFYKVNDSIESMIDKETLTPRYYQKILHEGKREKHEYIQFKPGKDKAYYYKKNFDTGKFRRYVLQDVPENAQDPLSMLFYLRHLEFHVGDKVILPVCTDKKHWTLTFAVEKEETIDIRRIGSFQTLKIKPKFEFEGLFVHKGDIEIWLHKQYLFPVLVRADIPIGYIEISLKKRTGVQEGVIPDPAKAKKKPRRRRRG